MSLALQEIIPSQRCTVCKKYLSHFPIHLTTDCTSVCGRCSLDIDPSFLRNKPYEEIASHIKFPCIYDTNGCVEALTPTDMQKHEKLCSYRKVDCPDSENCEWHGSYNDLREHINDKHKVLFLKNNEFELDLLNSYFATNVLLYEDEIFKFIRSYDGKDRHLYCTFECLGVIDTSKKYTYEIAISNAVKSREANFASNVIADQLLENGDDSIAINVDLLEKCLESPSVMIGKVNIIQKFTPIKQEEITQTTVSLKSEMLEELECPICFNLMLPPIYQCITGHSICDGCKEKIKTCPTCQKEIQNTQNYSLQNIASRLMYPCRYQEYGCNFIELPKNMKKHQPYCLFGPQECPLKDYEECNWKGASKDVRQHLNKEHQETMLEIETMDVFIDQEYYNDEDRACYILEFNNNMFKLDFMYFENKFLFAVQLIGPPEKCVNYYFEIDIFDRSGNNKKLLQRNVCAPINDMATVFNTPGNYVLFTREQVQGFIGEDYFTYRIGMLLK